MKKFTFLFVFIGGMIGSYCNTFAQSSIITTIAGTGVGGYSGDDSAATNAELNGSIGLAVDRSGNVYIADENNNRLRKVSTSGIITTIAGTGVAGYSGDGGPATAAEIKFCFGVVVDGNGNVYVTGYNRVRKIDTAGIISTFAGNGVPGNSGDGGPATAGELNNPYGLAIDSIGNIYIADQFNATIRKVNTSGTMSTIAGNGIPGFSGDGGPATAAQINSPYGIAVDGSGNVYIADEINNRIRKVSASGIITTIAGTGAHGFSGDGGPATGAELASPYGVAINNGGALCIVDYNRIREVSTAGIISTIVGDGIPGYSGDGGPATLAEIDNPQGITADRSGSIFISDQGNQRIRKVGIGPNAVANTTFSSHNDVSIFPNPASDQLTIKTDGTTYDSYMIGNMHGAPLLMQNINGTLTTVDIKALPAGVYYLIALAVGKEVAVRKFVKE